MEKQCFKCGRVLALTEFYKHPQMADGHFNKCKQCSRKDNVENRNNKREYYIQYDKNRANTPERAKAREEYRKTDKGKKAIYNSVKNYRAKHPERQKIYRDCLKKLDNPHICSNCGSDILVEAHHNDYSKPFEVVWLCRKCHRNWHKTNNFRLT